ncbi:aldehyde dehydrogenase family protein, partial [Streptomyces sp. SID10244]|nr:aldehyde dehydrogenase family protein [Streptomyces sp. SID10244]
GLDSAVAMGPLASAAQLIKYREYVAAGLADGAVLRTPEPDLDGRDGYFAAPAIFTDTTPDMRIVREEIFGPVLAVQRARDHTEAIELANATRFGMSAAIITRDLQRA